MKPYIALTLTACIFVGCAAKTKIPAPTAEMVAESGESAETLKRGHLVYSTHCTRCHEPIMPSEISGTDWHVVVPGMAWNAGISEADENAVLKYIMAAR